MTRRQRLPRRRRSGVSTVLALLITAVATLSAIAAVQIYLGRRHTVFGDIHSAASTLRGDTWQNSGVAICGVVLAAVGALLLLAGLVPSRRALLALSDPDEHTLSGIARRGLRRDLVAVVSAVDGVTSARVRLRRRSVRVIARSQIRDRSGLADAVGDAVRSRLDSLGPAAVLAVRTRVVGKED